MGVETTGRSATRATELEGGNRRVGKVETRLLTSDVHEGHGENSCGGQHFGYKAANEEQLDSAVFLV